MEQFGHVERLRCHCVFGPMSLHEHFRFVSWDIVFEPRYIIGIYYIEMLKKSVEYGNPWKVHLPGFFPGMIFSVDVDRKSHSWEKPSIEKIIPVRCEKSVG